jgi:ribose transport system substrate-binding protein
VKCSRQVAAAVHVAVVLTLVSCHADRVPTIAVIPETTAQEIWESEHAGAEHEARQFGWKIYWNGPSREDDVPRQIQIVDQEIGRGVSGLVLSPDHAIAMIAPLRRALQKKIPAVIVGDRIANISDPRLSWVLNDEGADGLLAARRAELYLGPGKAIAVLGMNPNFLSLVDRANAIEAEIRAHNPKTVIAERRSDSFGFAEAEQIAEDTLRALPNLAVIVSLNVNQSRAAYQALLSTNRLNTVRLIACDQDLDLMHHLRTGGIDAVVAPDTGRMGRVAIVAIHDSRSGSSAPVRAVIEPVLITRSNIDSAPVQQLLSMDWSGEIAPQQKGLQ